MYSKVNYGVPRLSVLVPILFILYMCPLGNNVYLESLSLPTAIQMPPSYIYQ